MRNLLDSFEADGPGCIKLLNEHGQRSVLTIDYSNPITSDAESGGVCVGIVPAYSVHDVCCVCVCVCRLWCVQ